MTSDLIAGPPQRRYRERDADNARWSGFRFRHGDVVIDAPSKSGTTWTQLLVALLVFDGPTFPATLGRLSPWMEQTIRSTQEAHDTLAAQTHRRLIKSHTPLDGVPMLDEVRYVCVGRDPRDAAVSMLHHSANMNRDRFDELIAHQTESSPPGEVSAQGAERTDGAYFDQWIDDDDPGPTWSLRFLAHHYTTFWERRHLVNVELVHFSDYLANLPGELERLASHLNIPIEPGRADELASEAAISRVRMRAADVAPEAHLGVWNDPAAFFRSGTEGEWRDRMSAAQVARYEKRISELVAPDLAEWMQHGRRR